MTAAGLEAYSRRTTENSGIYSFENEEISLTSKLETIFRENITAWEFFSNQTPSSYRKMVIRWVMSAKQEITHIARLEKLIVACEQKKRIY